jgi:hypothetical protein
MRIAPKRKLDLGPNLHPEAGETPNTPSTQTFGIARQFDVHVKHRIAMSKTQKTNPF